MSDQNNYDKWENENGDQEEQLQTINSGSIAVSDIFTKETMEQIQRAKETHATNFESYWENDESNLDAWSKDQIDNDPFKQFVTSAEYGQLDQMKELMSQQIDLELKQKFLTFKDSDGYTALHRAAYSNHLDVVKYLISLEQDERMPSVKQLEARTDMGWTALHSATYWNCHTIVDYLLKFAHADVNARTNSNQTALHLAAQNSTCRESLLILLTDPFIDYDIKNDQNETAQQIANRSCKYYSLFEMCDPCLNNL